MADAIRDHYRPQGPSDEVPTAPVSVAVALADKLDTLVGFFAIDGKPTGSRDPFALRRAALGVIRILLASSIRIALRQVIKTHLGRVLDGDTVRLAADFAGIAKTRQEANELAENFARTVVATKDVELVATHIDRRVEGAIHVSTKSAHSADLLAFLADRLKVLLRDHGKRHDLVDAVFALGDDDLVRIVARVEALDGFLDSEDGANLLAGYKRATNILKAEEKKGPLPTGAAIRLAEDQQPEEIVLFDALARAWPAVDAALAGEDFAGAMRALAGLRAPVDGFFDKVLVNADDAAERGNRLRLLIEVRDAMGRVADFSRVSG